MTLREEVERAAFLYATDRDLFNVEFGNTIHEIYLHDNFSDANFSSLAESIPLKLCGWSVHEEKHQYDGFHGVDYSTATDYCECKPEKAFKDSKLSGHANWNDITPKKLQKLKNDKLTLMFSGWIDGNLMYVASLPHNYSKVMNTLERQVESAITNHKPRINGTMTWRTWIECPDLKVHWFAKEQTWLSNKDRYNKKFIDHLRKIYASCNNQHPEKIHLNIQHDSYFCQECNIWIAENCKEVSCDFCASRPETPLQKNIYVVE